MEKAINQILLDEQVGGKGRHFSTRFLQAGLVKYSFGVCLLEKETIDKFIYNFVGCPVIINHKDVTNESAKDDRVGVISRVWFNDKDGWYWGEGVIFEQEALDLIDKGYNVSCQYEISEYSTNGGIHNGNDYDKVILNGKPEHLAIVKNPRYENAMIAVNANDEKKQFVTVGEGDGQHVIPVDYMKGDKKQTDKKQEEEKKNNENKVTLKKETKKAYLLEKEGVEFWVQKRWYKDGKLTPAGEKSFEAKKNFKKTSESLKNKNIKLKGKPDWESEKAIGIDVNIDYYDIEQDKKVRMFIPKSQIKNNSIPFWLYKKKIQELLVNSETGYGGFTIDKDGFDYSDFSDDEKNALFGIFGQRLQSYVAENEEETIYTLYNGYLYKLDAVNAMEIDEMDLEAINGGEGSGDFDHAGRPGKVGGSEPAGTGRKGKYDNKDGTTTTTKQADKQDNGKEELAKKYAQSLGDDSVGGFHERIAEAFISKDVETLSSLIATSKGMNEGTKHFFEEQTGIKLPSTIEGKKDAILEWAGIDKNKYKQEQLDKQKKEMQEKKQEQENQAKKDLLDYLNYHKTQLESGEVVTRKEYLDRFLNDKKYEIKKIKQGIKPAYQITFDEEVKLPSGKTRTETFDIFMNRKEDRQYFDMMLAEKQQPKKQEATQLKLKLQNDIMQAINELKETDMFKNLFRKRSKTMDREEMKDLFMECLTDLTASNEKEVIEDEEVKEEVAENKCKNKEEELDYKKLYNELKAKVDAKEKEDAETAQAKNSIEEQKEMLLSGKVETKVDFITQSRARELGKELF